MATKAEEEPSKKSDAKTEDAPAASTTLVLEKRLVFITLGILILVLPLAGFAITRFVLAPRIAAVKNATETPEPEIASSTSHSSDTNHSAKSGSLEDESKFILTELVVNVKGTKGNRFLRCSKLSVEGPAAVIKELKTRKDQISDIISSAMSSKRLEDVEADDFREKLRVEITTLINSVLKTGEIGDIFFTELVVQ